MICLLFTSGIFVKLWGQVLQRETCVSWSFNSFTLSLCGGRPGGGDTEGCWVGVGMVACTVSSEGEAGGGTWSG